MIHGPLVALFSPGEGDDHVRCTAMLDSLRGPLTTTQPCLTEAMYLLGGARGWRGQLKLWQLFEDQTLQIFTLGRPQMLKMYSLMAKYSDTPMDFADASLVIVAEVLNTNKIFTLDSDFSIYRINGRKSFEIIP